MGQCYDVKIKLRFDDCEKVVLAMQKYMDSIDGKTANLGIDYWKDKGLDFDKLDDMMKVWITDRNFSVSHGRLNHVYRASFDASYGWGVTMLNIFDAIAPTLNDNSEITIIDDSEIINKTIKGGTIECKTRNLW